MNYNMFTEIDASRKELGTGIDLREKCNHFLYDRRIKMNQWNAAVKNQLSAYEWLKQNIYSDKDE